MLISDLNLVEPHHPQKTAAEARADDRKPPRPQNAHERAIFLSESVEGVDEGAHFLDHLTDAERAQVKLRGRTLVLERGDSLFSQGDPHSGIFIIDEGRVRVFYTAPSGREITLAYWTRGHFCGGPEITGGGTHIWSGVALEKSRITLLPSTALRSLITQIPNFALCLIEGLVAKGKSYSAMAQMLGTRSVGERLARYLLNLGELYGEPEGETIVIRRRVTHDQIAAMVGSTRQWVTMTMNKFRKLGLVSVGPRGLRLRRPDLLQDLAG